MNYLRIFAQACLMFAYFGLCSALFYTNSKENDYPRIGKRPFFLQRPLRRIPYTATDSVIADTDLSNLFEKYPYLDPAATVGLLSDTEIAEGIDRTNDVDATAVEHVPQQRNKVYVMFDDSEANKEPIRRVPWTGPGSSRRQRIWERYQP